MKKIDELPENVGRIVIAGHIHPDGDCVGSCLGLKNYLSVIRPRAQVDICWEPERSAMNFRRGSLTMWRSCWTAAIRNAWEMQ